MNFSYIFESSFEHFFDFFEFSLLFEVKLLEKNFDPLPWEAHPFEEISFKSSTWFDIYFEFDPKKVKKMTLKIQA